MHAKPPSPTPAPSVSPRRRELYNLIAWLCFGLGFLGMVVPLMPTTVFWICATWLWLRSRPQRVRFLIEHPRFGESIRDFLEHGEICRTGKIAALSGMAGSYLIWMLLVGPGVTLGAVVGLILATVALWIATRPDSRYRRRQQARQSVRVELDLGRLARAPAGSAGANADPPT
ncbi:MAG: YbaN family protein [Chromatiaceae bacterium]|nr:YbaN family protein [Chromatiaceae bacterium]